MSIRSKRKEEHLTLAQMFFDKEKVNSFDQMHLLRPTLPESVVDPNSIKTRMFGKDLDAPFFINAMTGGSAKSLKINQALGKIAHQEKIAFALGSASILVNENDQLESFFVARKENPDGVIIANVNPLTSARDARRIVEEIQADALQIHLNTIQEAAMPEGDRDFRWLNNLIEIRQSVDKPIIIKEVGFGFDSKSIKLLQNNGFDLLDLAGSGGTNFAQIENARNNHDVSYLEDLGLPTVVSAMMAKKEGIDFIVSGGVRNPLDVLKGLVLGGKYVGISNFFLQEMLSHDAEYLQELVQNWKKDLAILLALYGCNNLSGVSKTESYFDLALKTQLDQLI
ncbi:type 2 isopentenyl-diphosphate Delta-isomerase [Lactobacillus pasteurii]|uniref:Isopentenyl-diphosphate delta-isomerase n=1 Tax=Lactobacillus pasteurii DSM 23907 = CRBIP 24.76 TaxID=1423790 RepID=I7JYI8_9LACO|nr:type 2 isopentenyl-diphosphate Delta-isomerase [Lactobacillus pasteurii]TDG75731.1 hypothetical protein C5L33_000616 [Lactobacillus pasteurii]CCI85585.1 Isopentenyl-diphosphate delta-isomerase [Lactobacillus pasteurii DSM 23907 = CRBIP 24.76]